MARILQDGVGEDGGGFGARILVARILVVPWVMLSLEGSAQEASILAWSILPTVLLCVECIGGGVGEQLLMSTYDRRVCWGSWE